MKQRSICILYGVNEGPAIGWQFQAACRRAGLRITHNAQQADLIFTHSAGCFLIPTQTQAKRIITVGPLYLSGKPLLGAALQVIKRDYAYYQRHYPPYAWFVKFLEHVFYSFRLDRDFRMWLGARRGKPWNSLRPIIAIRNTHDVYCSPDASAHITNPHITFTQRDGEHDDCWYKPEPYIDSLLAP